MSYDPNYLEDLISQENVDEIKSYMEQYDLILDGNKIIPKPDMIKAFKKEYEFLDKRQHIRKILLNS